MVLFCRTEEENRDKGEQGTGLGLQFEGKGNGGKL